MFVNGQGSLRKDAGSSRTKRIFIGGQHALLSAPKQAVQVCGTEESAAPTSAPGQEQKVQSKPQPKVIPQHSKPFKLGGQMLYDFQTGYEPQFYEYDYYLDEAWIEGEVPEDIQGTFFTICPGLTQVFGTKVRNAADADGMVASFSFASNKKVFFRNRFVRTPSFQAEQLAGRRVSRGLHDKGASDGGWLFNPLDLSVRSSANSAVLHWANKLYALSEHALPHELNRISLETVGESELDGLLTATRTLVGKYREVTTASGTKNVALMSSQQSGPDAAVRFMELDTIGKVVATTSHRVGGCMARMLTDFLVTDNYYVLVQSPLSFNLSRFMSRYIIGEVSFAECIDYESEQPAHIHLVPRPQPVSRDEKTKEPLVIEIPPLASFSAVNAYELDGGNIVVADVVAQEGTHFFKDLGALAAGYYRGEPKPELTRITVDVKGKSATTNTLSHRSFESATVAPASVGRPHTCMWATASINEDAHNWGPNQVITKLSVHPSVGVPALSSSKTHSRIHRPSAVSSEVWAPGPRDFVGPPTFVPKSNGCGDEDGWILTMLHNAETKRAELIILDGSNLAAGPVASLLLPHHMPHASGGQWVNKYLGPARGAPPSWQPKTQPPGAPGAGPAAGAPVSNNSIGVDSNSNSNHNTDSNNNSNSSNDNNNSSGVAASNKSNDRNNSRGVVASANSATMKAGTPADPWGIASPVAGAADSKATPMASGMATAAAAAATAITPAAAASNSAVTPTADTATFAAAAPTAAAASFAVAPAAAASSAAAPTPAATAAAESIAGHGAAASAAARAHPPASEVSAAAASMVATAASAAAAAAAVGADPSTDTFASAAGRCPESGSSADSSADASAAAAGRSTISGADILRKQVADAPSIEFGLQLQLQEMQRRLDRMVATERALRQQVAEAIAPFLKPAEAEQQLLPPPDETAQLKVIETEENLDVLSAKLAAASDLEVSLRRQLAEASDKEAVLQKQLATLVTEQDSMFATVSEAAAQKLVLAVESTARDGKERELVLSQLVAEAKAQGRTFVRKLEVAGEQIEELQQLQEASAQRETEAKTLISALESCQVSIAAELEDSRSEKVALQLLTQQNEKELDQQVVAKAQELMSEFESARQELSQQFDSKKEELSRQFDSKKEELSQHWEVKEKELSQQVAEADEKVATLEKRLVARLIEEQKIRGEAQAAREQESALLVQLYESLEASEVTQRELEGTQEKLGGTQEKLGGTQEKLDATQKELEGTQEKLEVAVASVQEAAVKATEAVAREQQLQQSLDAATQVIGRHEESISSMLSHEQFKEALTAQEAEFKEHLNRSVLEMQQLMEAELGAQLGFLESAEAVINQAASIASRVFTPTNDSIALTPTGDIVALTPTNDSMAITPTDDSVHSHDAYEPDEADTAELSAQLSGADAETPTAEPSADLSSMDVDALAAELSAEASVTDAIDATPAELSVEVSSTNVDAPSAELSAEVSVTGVDAPPAELSDEVSGLAAADAPPAELSAELSGADADAPPAELSGTDVYAPAAEVSAELSSELPCTDVDAPAAELSAEVPGTDVDALAAELSAELSGTAAVDAPPAELSAELSGADADAPPPELSAELSGADADAPQAELSGTDVVAPAAEVSAELSSMDVDALAAGVSAQVSDMDPVYPPPAELPAELSCTDADAPPAEVGGEGVPDGKESTLEDVVLNSLRVLQNEEEPVVTPIAKDAKGRARESGTPPPAHSAKGGGRNSGATPPVNAVKGGTRESGATPPANSAKGGASNSGATPPVNAAKGVTREIAAMPLANSAKGGARESGTTPAQKLRGGHRSGATPHANAAKGGTGESRSAPPANAARGGARNSGAVPPANSVKGGTIKSGPMQSTNAAKGGARGIGASPPLKPRGGSRSGAQGGGGWNSPPAGRGQEGGI